ncbi:hypothetical protein GW796_09370 [archaeon]|nr:hypothetical protein [archaeon]NCT58938.1 hypothetical protein [archaeon]
MNIKEYAKENKILEIRVGSHLYGTNIETSDEDFMGIFIAPKEYYLGLKTLNEVDLSIISKQENGKNNKEAVDKKFYEFRKYIKLLMEGNPSLIETIFVNDENIIYENEIGKQLREMRDIFPSMLIKQKFIGYAISQMHKMHIKADNYTILKNSQEWLATLLEKNNKKCLLAEFKNDNFPEGIKFFEQHAKIGDLNISLKEYIYKVKDKIDERMAKVGNRKELITKYGFDSKFGMHCCRLMLEGLELIKTGNLIFPLKEKALLLDIRNGKYSKEEVLAIADELKLELDSIEKSVFLPKVPNFDNINNYLINTVQTAWR